MQNSEQNTKALELSQKHFSVNLKDDRQINNCIEIIEGFICKYDEKYIDNLEYNSIVKELLKYFKENKKINNNLVEELAKKYNENNNKHLIMKEEKIKKGFFYWLLRIFKVKDNKEITIDTKNYDQEERRLTSQFNDITKSLEKYVNEVLKLKNILSEEKFKGITAKVFAAKEINSDLINLLDELKNYREYIDSKESVQAIDEVVEVEELVEEIAENFNVKTLEIANLSEEKLNSSLEDRIEIENKIKLESSKELENNEKLQNNEEVEGNEELEEKDEVNIESLLISEIFNENIFKIFLNYCDENNLKTLNHLKDFDFNELDKLKGFGVGKKEKLIKKYLEVIGNDYIQKVQEEKVEFDIKVIRIKECYKNLDISVLQCFNKVNAKLIDQIKEYNINTIEELNFKLNSSNISIPNLGATKTKYIKDALENLNKEPQELFRDLMDEIKENPDYDILLRRVVKNETLQQIGEVYGVTRERIRQKENKIIKSLEGILGILIGVLDIKETKLVLIEDILNVSFSDDTEKECLKGTLISMDNHKYKYVEEIDKFLVNGDIEKIRDKIASIANCMPDIVNINNELIYDLQEYTELNILSLDDVVKIILTLGYKQVNEYLFRGSISKTKIYNFIVKEFFRNGITFSKDEDINKFISILDEKFDIQEESTRNIKARIETNCVLYDRGSYIHSEWVDIDERLLYEIKDYIDNNEQETLYINQIFVEFEDSLNRIGVKNRYYLQGILKYYYSEKYNFARDILYKGNIKHDRNYIFNKYIKEKQRPVTKEDIENDLKGWTSIMLTMAEDECKYVLKWDKGGFIHASLIKASLEDISGISEVLREAFNNKESLTDNEAYGMLSEKFKCVFDENNIDNSFKLFSILEYLLSKEYYFRRPYILKDKPREAVSAVYLMKKLFNNNAYVTLEELKEFCNNIKLNDSTRMQSINNLLKDTVEVEKETYILKDSFEVDEDVIENFKEILLNKIDEKGYIALNTIEDYSTFPNIQYEWNTYILRDICEHYIPEVKELKRQFYDKRYPAPVIVRESSKMNELLDLIIDILKNEFEEGIEVNELSCYLKENNIIYDSIPFEIYNCEEIIVEDNIIRLS